jgi:hypothetical protein
MGRYMNAVWCQHCDAQRIVGHSWTPSGLFCTQATLICKTRRPGGQVSDLSKRAELSR